jgi:hypothetical protein
MSEQPSWVLGAMRAHPALTAAGAARRTAMGEMLQAAVVSRRRRRVAFRLAGAAAVAMVLALLLSPGISPDPGAGLKHVAFETVRDDPGILARYAARPAAIPAETWIEDDELLDLLRSADRPTGLIRIDDRVILTVDVTDIPPE